jgi:hypothetical protein
LNPAAIATLVSQIENLRERSGTHEVQQSREKAKEKVLSNLGGEIDSLGDSWINEIHTTRVWKTCSQSYLKGVFDTIKYHGLALTNWMWRTLEDLADIKTP